MNNSICNVDLDKYKNNLLFMPLGGTNEIGMNVNLYHIDGKWIMIDCGSSFADKDLPGANIIMADINLVAKLKPIALILTHVHEDHLGAVQYFWSQMQCPIYTTKFTARFLRFKLVELGIDVDIVEVEPESIVNIGPFRVKFVPITHSTVESQSIMLYTKVGNVLHTGDWRFDDDPIVGAPTDYKALKSYGDEGVLALVCDSTNVFNTHKSPSEGSLRLNLIEMIAQCKKAIVITMFASNLARLSSLIKAGQDAKRHVAILGKSLRRIYTTAVDSGYLHDTKPLIHENSIVEFAREELLIIATGCQGEELGAINKLANNKHRSFTLASGDTVIFSSKFIPGNEKEIFRVCNALIKRGICVITHLDHFVHVTGHPSSSELTEMHNFIRPKICVPVHGEPMHIQKHAYLAKKNGIGHIITPENGSIVLLNEFSPHIVTNVNVKYFAIDGNYMISTESDIFKTRKTMNTSGAVIAFLAFDKFGFLLSNPILATPGSLDVNHDKRIINILEAKIVDLVNEMMAGIKLTRNKTHRINRVIMEKKITNLIRYIIRLEINKYPLIDVIIKQVSGMANSLSKF